MRKYILISFVSVFFLSLFILNADSVFALKPIGCTETSDYSTITGQSCSTGEGEYSSTYFPSCSSTYGYKLITSQLPCSTLTGTPAVFNFKASDPDNDNLSWYINWGDTESVSKKCPSSFPNTLFSASHTWPTAGTYNVKLGVSDCNGGDTEATFRVVVKTPIPVSPPAPTTPSADLTDIVISSTQDIPDKLLWYNAISFPINFEVRGTYIPDFLYNASFDKTNFTTPLGFLPMKPGSYKFNFRFSTDTCGAHNIKVVFNPDKKIPEKDYSNNVFEKIVNIDCITPPYDFDMTIEKVGTWPTTAVQGKWITLNAKFYNIGKEYNSRFALLYTGYSKDKTIPNYGEACLFRTDSTGTYRMQCPSRSPQTGDAYYIMDQPVCGNNHYVMKVDAYNDVIETNENNNEVSGDIFVNCN